MHRNRTQSPAACVLFVLLFVPWASVDADAQPRAESNSADRAALRLEQLPEEIERAKAQFTPIEAEEVERRRRALLAAMDRMERFLSRADEATQAGWKRYLRWDDLRREAEKSTEPDLAVFRAVDERLLADVEGLEREPFVELRAAIRAYVSGVYTRTDPGVQDTYRQVMDVLKQLVEQYLAEPSTDQASQMGPMLEFLEQTEQAPQVTTALRQHFRYPNLRIGVSRDLIAVGVERDVDEPTTVNEFILGTRVTGSGRTRGRVRLALEPSDDQATLVLALDAQARTENVGVNGPVTLYSTGVTDIQALHTIYLNRLGLFAGEVVAQACVHTNIYCIVAKLRIIERIAWRQAEQSQAEAEAISSARATRRAEQQFSQQVREQLREPNENFQEKVVAPLTRRRLFPDLLQFSTTTERLHVAVRHAAERQLASPTPPPADVGGDLSVRIHETAIGNFSESALAGRTFTAEEFAEMNTGMPTRSCPESAPEEEQSDRDWSVTFRDRQPISAVFRDGQATLQIHFERVSSEGEDLNYPIDIAAVYSIDQGPDGPKLVREGRVQVTWPTSRRPRFGQRAVLESKFRVRFERMFCEEMFVRDIDPPDAPEAFGALRDVSLKSEDGWFTAGFRHIPTDRKPNN